MRAVVAGVDLTAMGRRVAERARIVAEDLGEPLDLVHVLEPVSEAMIGPGLARLMRRHEKERVEELGAWCRERSEIDITVELVKGVPSWELGKRGKGAALIVVGSSAIDAFTAGPVTRRVARMATSDVLVVKRQPRVPYRRVIAAVDFSEASRVAVERSLERFPDAETTVLYSLPSRFDPVLHSAGLFEEELEASRSVRLEAAKDRMAEFTMPWNGRIKTLVADGPPMQTVDEVVRRRKADLVVVGSRGATATKMVLLGTVAEGLVEQAPCDVYVARSPSAFRRP